MTYETQEESQDSGLPVSLFLFVYGSDPSNYYAYCDVDVPVTKDGVVFNPTVIGREKIEESGGLDNKTLEIDITPRAEIVEFYRTRQPSQVVSLTIWQGHVGDPDEEFVVVWSGRVIGVEQKAKYARINADPIVTSMRRPGLRRHYQYGCPWVLYSTECGANQAAAQEVAATLSVGTNFIEFADGWQGVKTKAKFLGGFLQWTDAENGTDQIRTILNLSVGTGDNGGDVLGINGSTDGLYDAQNVTLFLGCNHRKSDCADLHNNIVNFGGQPWIPKINPIGFVNRFY